MKVNNYPLKTPSAGDKLFGSDSVGNQKQFDMSAVSNNVFKYQIGEYVEDEGGVIAHRWLSDVALGSPISGSFENYLVISIVDQSNSNEWSNIVDTSIGSSAQSLWDGLNNSIAIINQPGQSNSAAEICDSYSFGSINDWYLPSIDELYKIWQNRWEISQGLINAGESQLAPEYYWSSTEVDADYAWYFNFYSGSTSDNGGKSTKYYVRAVRKFSI